MLGRMDMTTLSPERRPDPENVAVLQTIETRLHWLSSWTIHNANHFREGRDGLKVGGHQVSCASITAI